MEEFLEDVYVSFDTAKLAKEKGFNLQLTSCYFYDWEYFKQKLSTSAILKNHNADDESYSAPTQSILQRWLRNKYNIQVYVYSHTLRNEKWGDYVVYVNNEALNDARDEEFQTYEEAMEFGLAKALKKI